MKFVPLMLIVVLMVTLALREAAAQPSAPASTPSIRALGDDLYDVQLGAEHAMFVVTADSIVVVDPLGVPTAQWLRKEFDQRFPGKPVRYVVSTHHFAERASGNGAFPGASRVAQEEFARALRETPGSNTEKYRYVVGPQQAFKDRLTLKAGDKTIELVHVGPFYSRELSVVVFPWARKVFAVDAPPIHSAPFKFGTLNVSDVVKWLSTVAAIDFDTMLFDDGTTMARDQIVALAGYLARMRAEVVSGYGRGRSLERLQQTTQLDSYRSLPHYAARREQIASMFEQMSYSRVDFVITGLASYIPEDAPEYCNGYASCSSGGALGGASLAATVALGRKYGAQLEVLSSDQFWATRAQSQRDEEVVFRPSRASLLLRYSPLKSAFTYALLAGVSRSWGDVEGMYRITARLAPEGGRHQISRSESRLAYTAGFDLSQRMGPLRLVFPLRITYTTGELPDYWPGAYDAQAGIGLAIPLIRRLQ